MKLIRNISLIILFVFTLSIISLSLITYYIQPESFKLFAQKQLSMITHQESAIDGKVNWRILPRPGLQVTKVRIGDVNEKQTDYAFKVKELIFHMQLLPLFQGKIVFDKLILDEFTLRVNFDNLTAPKNTKALDNEAPAVVNPSKPVTSAIPTPGVALNKLLLTNGQIFITQGDEELQLTNVRIETEVPNKNEEAIPLQLKASFKNESEARPLSGTLNYKGTISLPPLDTINTPEKLKLNGQVVLQDVKAGPYEISRATSHLYFKDEKLSLNPLNITLYGGESVGQLAYVLKSHALTFQQTGTNVQAEPIFQHLFDIKPAHVTGLLDFSIHAEGNIDKPNWAHSMKANGNLTLKDGDISYLNIPQITDEATQTIKALASQNIENLQQILNQLKPWSLGHYTGSTPFQLFNIQYQAKGDAFLYYHTLLETKKLHLKGQGTLQLETHALHANLIAHVTTEDHTVQAAQQLLNGFPVLVTGTLEKPVVTPDKPVIRRLISSGEVPVEVIKTFKNIRQQIKNIRD